MKSSVVDPDRKFFDLPNSDPDTSIIKQKCKKTLDFYFLSLKTDVNVPYL